MPRLNLYSNYVGIDPGQNGGMVAIHRDGTVASTKMPATRRDVFDWLAQTTHPIAVVEKVHAMPKQGVSSSFKFGMQFERVCMALVAARIPFREVTPQAWMKGMSIPPRKKTESGTQWKNRLKGIAQQLFPSVNVTLATADAFLIAEYCRRTTVS